MSSATLPPATNGNTSRKASANSAPRGGILEDLGVVGMERIEPVILASLVSGDPLLLIGSHGTGKSYLLERLALALGLEWRHYNASLLNFDDLVGYPLPDERGSLRYVQTPSSVWGAEAVFIDEISRCRPDIQNKLFPLIHERKVQGLPLEQLRYRWSAMNPPSTDEDTGPFYAGSEPLDLALADRFAFVVEIPGWSSFTPDQRESLVFGSGCAIQGEARSRLKNVVANGSLLFPDILTERSRQLATYIRLVVDALAAAGITLTARRAALLLRNIASVHAVRLVLDSGAQLSDSAFLALSHSFPQPASGTQVDSLKVLASHRHAWHIAAVPPDDPLRLVLSETDPVRRVLRAARIATLPPAEFSSVVADSLAGLKVGGRYALAAALFESGAAGNLVAAIAEQCAELYSTLCTRQPVRTSVHPGSERAKAWKAIESALALRHPTDSDTVMFVNLLADLFNRQVLKTEEDVTNVVVSWRSTRAAVRSFE